MRNYKRSRYIPINVEKYVGDIDKIVCRSSWERKFCRFLDMNRNVTKWSSEEVEIPYLSPKDGNIHRYIPDFFLIINGKNVMIEIKPEKETKTPLRPKRFTGKLQERFIVESIKFSVNVAKWKYAKRFCDKNNIEFLVYTEKHLRQLGIFI